MDKALKSHMKKIDPKVLRNVLSTCTAFSGFSESDFDLLVKGSKRVFVPAGTQILRYPDI